MLSGMPMTSRGVVQLTLFCLLMCTALSASAALAAEAAPAGDPRFELLRQNPSANGERREVVRFQSDGLTQYALLLWPAGERPAVGWPVVLLNHGYHPDPPAYGRVAGGRNDRPGDYYRAMAQAYVDRGFLVVVPDYRGHNDSEGLAYTQRDDAPVYYARDAVAAFHALSQLEGIDLSHRYLVGHSMGGLVTLYALAGLGDKVTAASIWSTMQPEVGRGTVARIATPVLLQHARGDRTTPLSGSEHLQALLEGRGATVALEVYPSDEHLFSGEDFAAAVARDLAWFARAGVSSSRVP